MWQYDFVHGQLANGGPFKMLCVLDENTRECLTIEVGKSLQPGRLPDDFRAEAYLWQAGLYPLG
jgi:hypothetical protein